ncbi:twin-arginine translocation signal domain-containing protein, partial [Mycolicibacterium diernhoferi]|uniref:twin-arginine translocation signal domain-containing protein n=1 Tax=Mycolicibacterium diernhoferi TaxID=1801 RepID=UPI0010554C92
MPSTWSRRGFLLALAAGSAAAAAGCRSTPPGTVADDGSVSSSGSRRLPADSPGR